jgi:hypothetical protein
MKSTAIKLCLLTFTILSQSATAALFDIQFTGSVIGNQTHNGVCTAGQNGPGLKICQYFAIDDTITMSLRYDDTTPFYLLNNNPNSRVHDNAFSSLSLSSSSSTYSGYSGNAAGNFGQFMVRDGARDGVTIRLWESEDLTDNRFAYDTANDMDLTPLDTDLTFAPDDALGDIVIRDILINLGSLSNDIITSTQLPTSFNFSDFDDVNNTNWSMTFKNGLGEDGNPIPNLGFGASIGIQLTDITVSAVSSAQNNGSPLPEPSILALLSVGMIGLGFARRNRNI